MKIVADLHIHSKYSRAVSQDMSLENIAAFAKKKGINVMGTGDFTHPKWFEEIGKKLEPAEVGLFKLKNSDLPVRFMLTVEIANIYSKNGKTRRLHNLIFAPSLEAAEKINTKLGWIGNLKSDGRPILGLDSKELLKIILEVDSSSVLVPAHAWTPWFGLLGSMSGFDSIQECFDEMSSEIFAIETGLSSDPAMNWRLSALDNISLISNSDSHSLQKIGREANVFNCEMSYGSIMDAIKSKDPEKFLCTIEFFPEEGKYHYDGHANCGVSMSPEESKKLNDICPECGKKMTIGVLHRVDDLGDREEGHKPINSIPYKNFIPLDEVISEAIGVGPKSKSVMVIYDKLVSVLGNELYILIDAEYADIVSVSGNERVAEGVRRMREGKVKIQPGCDNQYGKISLFEEGEEIKKPQSSLF